MGIPRQSNPYRRGSRAAEADVPKIVPVRYGSHLGAQARRLRGRPRTVALPGLRRRSPGIGMPGRTEHSQITITRHPRRRSAAATRRSRRRFAANFEAQYSGLVRGTDASRHRPCRCQKQPCTMITVRYAGSTMSGVPGSDLTLMRKRKPRRWSARRTVRSGPVSAPRMLRMIRLRTCGETRSAMRRHTISVAGFSRFWRTVCRYSAAIAPSITR